MHLSWTATAVWRCCYDPSAWAKRILHNSDALKITTTLKMVRWHTKEVDRLDDSGNAVPVSKACVSSHAMHSLTVYDMLPQRVLL